MVSFLSNQVGRVCRLCGRQHHIIVGIPHNAGEGRQRGEEQKRPLEGLTKLNHVLIRVGITSADMFTLQQDSFRLHDNRVGQRQGKNSSSRVAEEDCTHTFLAHSDSR